MKHKPSKNNDRDKNITLYQKINEVGVQHFYIYSIELKLALAKTVMN